MLVKIPQILDAAGVARARALLDAAPWADGRSSAGTQAGLVTGLHAINAGVPLLGIGVRAPKPKQEERVD